MIFLHQQEIKEFQIYEIQRDSRAEAGQGAVRAAHRLLIHQCLGSRQPTPAGSFPPRSTITAQAGDSQPCQWDLGGLNHGCAPGCSRRVLHLLCPWARSFPQKQLLPLRPPAFHLAQHLHPPVDGEPFTPMCWSVWLCQNIRAKLVRSCYKYMCWLIKPM